MQSCWNKEGVRTLFKLFQNKAAEFANKRYERNERMLMKYKDMCTLM